MVFSKSERQEYVYTCSFIIKLCLPVYVQTSDTRYCNEEPMERTAEINSSLVGQTLSIDVTIYNPFTEALPEGAAALFAVGCVLLTPPFTENRIMLCAVVAVR